MSEPTHFDPDWLSPPGDTIREILAARSISTVQFASEMGASVGWAQELADGAIVIDEPLAAQLHRVLGPSETFWLNREQQYRDAAGAELFSAREWLRQLPIADMVKFSWISPVRATSEKISACLEFFGVPDVQTWRTKYRRELSVAAFRTSIAYAPTPAAVSAWLRWASLQARAIHCRPWSHAKLSAAVPRARELTRIKDPAKFLPQLIDICAEAGVALVVAPAPKGCRASGATQFLSEEKAMIVLSFRYRSDDHFWFTFFHEVGHLLLHPMAALFLEDDSEATSLEEDEANEFAANVLLSREQRAQLDRLPLRVYAISRFAREVGVSPGIVVGQLQHSGRLRRDRLNGLKRRYRWTQSGPEIIR